MTRQKTNIIDELTVSTERADGAEVRIAELNKDIAYINSTLTRLEQKFDDAISSFVRTERLADAQKAADQKHREQDSRIKKLEDWNIWATRLVLAAVLLAILGTVLITNKP